ncbi:MAG: hypothetical protein ACI9Y7_002817 [Dokdonia sp.]|jgi:hypothetical protein
MMFERLIGNQSVNASSRLRSNRQCYFLDILFYMLFFKVNFNPDYVIELRDEV